MLYTLGLKDLPFEQDPSQIIYVEGLHDEEINLLIRRNYEAIRSFFKMHGFEFCYMPLLKEELAQRSFLSYYAPSMKREHADLWEDDNFILNYMLHPENREKIPPSLLYYMPGYQDDNYPEAECLFRGVSLSAEILRDDPHLAGVLKEIERKIDESKESAYLSSLKRRIKFKIEVEDEERPIMSEEDLVLFRDGDDDEVRFSLDDKIVEADETFDEESKQLLDEIKEKIEQLKQKGISAYILKKYLEEEDVQLSRLLITKDYRILLPDYQNKEIFMTPLPKAVFLLFLKHPEGIAFKCLPDYQAELMDIYKHIKGIKGFLFDAQTIQKSVQDVTDPFGNSINEKCARIRNAFISEFDEHIAKHYCIDGKRGEAKTITLPRNLVDWEWS